MDKLPLLAAVGPACVVGVTGLVDRGRPGHSPPVTVAELTAWENAHGKLRLGDVVLLRSGWDSRYRPGSEGAAYGADVLVTATAPGWPAPTADAVGWLHERGVRCLGTDGLSIGPAGNGAPTHLAGLTRGMVFVEALAGLSALPPRGAWFLFLPLHLVAGAPGRALAVLP